MHANSSENLPLWSGLCLVILMCACIAFSSEKIRSRSYSVSGSTANIDWQNRTYYISTLFWIFSQSLIGSNADNGNWILKLSAHIHVLVWYDNFTEDTCFPFGFEWYLFLIADVLHQSQSDSNTVVHLTNCPCRELSILVCWTSDNLLYGERLHGL